MNKKRYIRIDADNVGDSIELALIEEDVQKSQEIHFKVQKNITKTVEKLESIDGISILMRGCDDILFSIDNNQVDHNFLEELKNDFKLNSGFSISIGIGESILKALQNLRIAKISGRNKIVGR